MLLVVVDHHSPRVCITKAPRHHYHLCHVAPRSIGHDPPDVVQGYNMLLEHCWLRGLCSEPAAEGIDMQQLGMCVAAPPKDCNWPLCS